MSEVPDAGGAVEAARAFVTAVAWGEHHTLCELLGPDARKTVLRVAVAAGMDEALAGRLREGTASEHELEEFLADLVNGLRADLGGIELDNVEYALAQESGAEGQARVVMTDPVPEILGEGLPVATVELAHLDGGWRVQRLIPAVQRQP